MEVQDDKVLYETNGSYGILYYYDQDATIIGFNLDNNDRDGIVGTDYFYVRNQQNDVIAIVNALGLEVVRYHYDAYGVLIDHSYVAGYENVFLLNPYTYRGYRYDLETGMYYLNSRYYNPEIGVMISLEHCQKPII